MDTKFYRNITSLFLCVYFLMTLSPVQSKIHSNPPKIGSGLLEKAQSFGYKHELDSLIVYADSASKYFQTTSNWEKYLEARAYFLDGHVSSGNIQGGRQIAEDAIQVASTQNLTGSIKMANIYETLAFVQIYFGEFDQAWQRFEKAYEIKKQHYPDVHLEWIPWYQKTGQYYYYTAQYHKGIEGMQKSKGIALALLKTDQLTEEEEHYLVNRFLGEIYINLSTLSISLGRYFDSETFNDSSYHYRLAATPLDSASLGENYNNYAIRNARIGDWHTALTYFQKARITFEKYKHPDPNAVTSIILNIGEAYSELKQFKRANKYFHQAIRLSRGTHFATGVVYGQIFLANNFRELALHDSSQYYFKRAELDVKNKPGVSPRSLSFIYGYQGLDAIDREEPDTAIHYFRKQQAVELSLTSDPAAVGRISSLRNLGYAHLEAGQEEKAFDFFNKGAALLGADTTLLNKQLVPPLAQIDNLFDLMLMVENTANVHRRLALKDSKNLVQWETYLNAHEQTMRLIDTLRIRSSDDANRQEVVKITDYIFENGMEAALHLFNLTQDSSYLVRMWPFMEKSKASMLLAGIRQSQIVFSDSLLRAEMDLRHEISFMQSKIRELPDSPDSTTLRILVDRNYELKTQQTELLNELNVKYPNIRNVLFDSQVLGIKQTQQEVLMPDEALLSYYWGKDELYYIAITQTEVKAGVIAFDSTSLLATTHQVIKSLYTDDARQTFTNQKTEFITACTELYKILITPIERIIANKKLIISPSGQLTRIPFELLLTEEPNSFSLAYKDLPYLLKKQVVRYTYSSSILRFHKTHKIASHSNKMLLVAPVFFKGDRDLPSTQKEVQLLSKWFSSSQLLEESASIQAFRKNAPTYEILHLAMHGYTDTLFPLNSALRFSGKKQDELLTLREIYGSPMQPELITLSACKTANGPHQSGEGVLSLGRGFQYAGARSTVMSLWDATGPETNKIMNLFYEALSQGMPKDEALREAKLRYLESSYEKEEIPAYWSNFVLYGDPHPIQKEKSYSIWILLGLLVVIGGIWWKLSNQKKYPLQN